MSLDLIRGLIIIFLLLSFAGMAIWLWGFADRRQLEEAANIPLSEGSPRGSEHPSKPQNGVEEPGHE